LRSLMVDIQRNHFTVALGHEAGHKSISPGAFQGSTANEAQ
jgi:hypothetical protein